MDSVQRVVVHDKHPVLEAEILARPRNRVVLAASALSLLVQIGALAQVVVGQGDRVGWFDHAGFSLVAFLWLALGVLVFLQRRSHRAGHLFLLSAATGSAFLALRTLDSVSLADAALYSAGLLFFPAFLLSFTRAFDQRRVWRRQELWTYVPPLILMVPLVHDTTLRLTSITWKAAIASVAVYLLASILQTFRDLQAAQTSEQAAQGRALLFGLLAGTVPGTVIFVVPAVLGNPTLLTERWIPPIVLLFLLAMSYAVLLREFSEADLILRRGVIYGTLTLVVVAVYGMLGVALTLSRATVTNPGGGLSFVAATVAVGAAFTPIRRASLRLVDWLIYGRQTDRWQLLQNLSARLATVLQPDELGDVLTREIVGALHLQGAFLVRRVEGGDFVVRHVWDGDQVAARYRPVPVGLALEAGTVHDALGDPPSWVLLIHARPLTEGRRDSLPERYHVLDDLRAALSVPLVTRSGLEAILCLRPKLAHDALDADDLELLAPVIRQATAALDNALLFGRLEDKVEELRRAYLRIAREQEAERARLARELHDGTAQEIAGLITLAAVVDRQMDRDDAAARSTLERLCRQAEDAYQGVRRASHALRPPMLDDFGLGPTLEHFVEQFRQTTDISIEFASEAVGDLPDEVELALFRVAQECLENVRKHSESSCAHVSLRRADGHVTLSVADRGRGLPPAPEYGAGLAGMRERVEAVGGVIRVQSAPGRGVTVEARIPLEVSA